MSLTCFVSHNANDEERVFVFRLQTLASASGIKVSLAQRSGRILTPETRSRIAEADVVIAFLTAAGTSQVSQELGVALGLGKPIIAIHRKGAPRPTRPGIKWLEYDPSKGLASIEQRIMAELTEHLTKQQSQQAAVVAVLGIALLALLATQSKK